MGALSETSSLQLLVFLMLTEARLALKLMLPVYVLFL
jgi:hypothetical protein